MYTCYYCGEVFDLYEDYANHFVTFHAVGRCPVVPNHSDYPSPWLYDEPDGENICGASHCRLYLSGRGVDACIHKKTADWNGRCVYQSD